MGVLPPGTVSVSRDVSAPAETVWGLLVDLDAWPRWGPSVRRATLESGARQLGPGARGTVWTVAGVALPFAVTVFEPGRRWAWTVAGVPATDHRVLAGPDGCRVTFDAPWWAAGYLAVCAVGLARIDRLARSAQRQ